MNRFFCVFALSALALAGCAASTDDDGDSSADEAITKGGMSAASAKTLYDLLGEAKAPSNTPAGVLGVGSRIARIRLNTAQGGMAHFISQSGSLSTVDGIELGNLFDLGGDWSAVKTAMTQGGGKFVTVNGDHGSSSSTMLATVECKQVVSPSAKPTCTVKAIELSPESSQVLMTVLRAAKAPSNTPAGVLGVGSAIGEIEVTTAQGGMAHFISQGGTVKKIDGTKLADLVTLGQAWSDVRDAVVNGGGAFTVTQGDHGASSSIMKANVTCTQVVAPSAKPSCTVTPIN
jgi:hypothetical protein